MSDYALQTIDLAPVAGKTIKLEFSGYSFDDSTAIDPNNGVYFHVDDVSVF